MISMRFCNPLKKNLASLVTDTPHIPVLLAEVLEAASGVDGHWIDGTLGAGGYTRALLDAGVAHVTGIDRDPEAKSHADALAQQYPGRFDFAEGVFSQMDRLVAHKPVDGIVLDIGVSSMQLDQAARGFSFRGSGPLDMRMAQDGLSAADIVNSASVAELSDILFQYGEEQHSRRVAQAIIAARPLRNTQDLAAVISDALPRARPGDVHPATRSFQALRIAVNEELSELARALFAAERLLREGGMLIVVTFHSLEDRIVKKFIARAAGRGVGGNRHAPVREQRAPTFEAITRKAVSASAAELAQNPRARSAKLRVARRTAAFASEPDFKGLGLPGRDLRCLGGQLP